MIKLKGSPGRRETLLIYLVIITFLLVGSWKIAGAALYKDLKTLQEEIGIIREESNHLRALLEDEDHLTAAWAKWHQEGEQLHTLIPDQSELDLVLGAAEKMLGEVNAGVHNFSVDNLNVYEGYSTASVALSVSCCPATARTLLSDLLPAFPHLLALESITWSANDDQQVELDLAFRLFFFSQAGAEEELPEGG